MSDADDSENGNPQEEEPGGNEIRGSADFPDATDSTPSLTLSRPWLRPTLYVLGIGIPGAVIADWLTDFDFVAGGEDPMFATIVFAMALILWFAPGAFDAATNAFDRIWHRGIIPHVDDHATKPILGFKGLVRATGGTASARYSDFIDRFNGRARSKLQWLAAAIFVTIAYGIVWSEVARDTASDSPIWFGAYRDLHGGLALAVVLAQLLVWALVGVVAWKVVIIALETARFSKSFRFEVLVGHPDKSGGLAVLGYMCFRLALVVTVPSILCAVWVVVLENRSPDFLYRMRYDVFETYYRWILAALIILTFIIAFRPLRGVHKGMLRGRNKIQVWLDSIAVRINRRSRSLLSKAANLDENKIKESRDQIAADQELISELGAFPTWPFDRATVVKLSASQVVPVFSMLGITGPVVDSVEAILSAIGG